MRSQRAAVVLAACGVLLCAGCSSRTGGMGADARALLQGDIRALTTAAAHRDDAAASADLTTLEADLAAARATGAISSSRFAELRSLISAVQADLAALAGSTASPTPSPSPSPSASGPVQVTGQRVPPPGHEPSAAKRPPDGHGHGHGHGGG